jgi:hypothetical protein
MYILYLITKKKKSTCNGEIGTNIDTHNEVYSIQLYVIKFVSDLQQVSVFLHFPPSIIASQIAVRVWSKVVTV